MPAANVTACCSAMPTSKKRSGYFLANFSSPVPEGIAAALAQARGWPEPILVAGSLFLVGEALAVLTGGPAPELSWQ